jgi:hypothetical protein
MTRTRTITLTIGSLAAGAVLATGVTGLAMAADATPNPGRSSVAPGATGHQDPGSTLGNPADVPRGGLDGRPGGPGHVDGMRGALGGDALHGEIVVKAADGTFSTVRIIRGTVTAVGADSISVKADDGYTATFDVAAATEIHTGMPMRPADSATRPTPPAAGAITEVNVGDVAVVEGTVTGSAATANEIHAMTAAEAAQLETDRAEMQAKHQAR